MDEILITSLQHFLELDNEFVQSDEEIWYRGQKNFEWDLKPSFFRLANFSKLNENTIFDIFIQNASMLITTPSNPLDWMFIMQHHGVNTRLLDWTENPMVALYFAVENHSQADSTDASLWLLKPKKLNKNAIGQDTIPLYTNEIVADHMKGQSAYNKIPAAILASRNNSRIQIQEGVFTVHLRDSVDIIDNSEEYLLKIKIPQSNKEQIFNQLKKLGINKFRLFPEISNIKTILEHKGLLDE